MNVSYEEIGGICATFPAGTCKLGQVCKINTEGKAAACAPGERFCGVTESLRGGYAGVVLHGFVTVVYTGTGMAPGYINLVSNGAGGVKADAAGMSYLVASVDTTEKTMMLEL